MTEEEAVSEPRAPQVRRDYWDAYYASRVSPIRPLPSQFAVFVATELDRAHHVVDFGCGSGRDSIFFAGYGHRVTGVDASRQAVAHCRALAEQFGEEVTFLQAAVDDPSLSDRLGATGRPRLLYARFFLHAITDAEEHSFLGLASALTGAGDQLAVEYRTIRDQSGSKTTAEHYRRFVSPARLQARAAVQGFEVRYAVEGFGFAKYREDDAYVAREIFVRS